MAATLRCSSLKGKQRENLFYKREREEMGAGTCYFKTYPWTLAYPLPPPAEPTVPAAVPIVPMRPIYSPLLPPPVSPTYGDQVEVSMLTAGARRPGLVSPFKTQQGTQFGPGATSRAGKFPLCWYPIGGFNANGQPARFLWMQNPFSTSYLLNWKDHNLAYREDPFCMTELFISVFATHHPTWADIHTLMNRMLTGDARRLLTRLERKHTSAI